MQGFDLLFNTLLQLFNQSFTSPESLWTSSSSLCQKLSKVFLILFSLHLSKSFCSKLSLSRKVSLFKNLCYSSFHSLLPLLKRILQGLTAWILFVSLFSLFQMNKGLTVWILLCLISPLSKNSKRHNLRILLILSFPMNKIFQRTNRLRILLFPPSQSFEGLTAWELCLNTLEGTSLVDLCL